MSFRKRTIRNHGPSAAILITLAAVACSSAPTKEPAERTGSVAEAVTGASCQARDIAARGDTTYAIAIDGKVYGWGHNGGGDPVTQSQYVPLGHRSTDMDLPLGNMVSTPAYLGVSGAKQVVAGLDGACALHDDGTVSCWGRELGDDRPLEQFLQAGLYRPAKVQALGPKGDGVPLTGVKSISYGDKHACALKTDGTVWCWGDDFQGQLGDAGDSGFVGDRTTLAVPMTGATDVARVVAAGSTTCILRTVAGVGQIACVGDNSAGQLGQGSGGNTGDVPHPELTPVNVPATLDFASLDGGGTGTFCASTKPVSGAQSTFCWGVNTFGQVGAGNLFGANSPVQISSNLDSSWAQGNMNGCEVTAAGAVACWGMNNAGSIPGANGGIIHGRTPIADVSGAFKVAVGNTHVCALTTSTLKCWGSSIDGQVGSGLISQVRVLPQSLRLSVPLPQSVCGNGGLGQVCGQFENTCGEPLNCPSCTGLNSCDATSHTCKDDPNKCSPACSGSDGYCSAHKCLNYCGSQPIADASVGVSITNRANYSVTTPDAYGNNSCGSYILEVTNHVYSSSRKLIVQPVTKPTESSCPGMYLTVGQYGDGKFLSQIGPIVGTWVANGAASYCKFNTTSEGIVTGTSSASFSTLRVAARLEQYVGGGGKGSFPYLAKFPVKIQLSTPTPPTPTCTDGIKNGSEAGVDCGGSCGPCEDDDNGHCQPGWILCDDGSCRGPGGHCPSRPPHGQIP